MSSARFRSLKASLLARSRAVVGRKQFKFYQVTDASDVSLPQSHEYEFARLSEQDLSKTPMCLEGGRMERYRNRLAAGILCYGHKHRTTSEVCSYFWVTDGDRIGEAPFPYGFAIKVPANVVYIDDCRVDPRHRGKKLYTIGLQNIVNLHIGRTIVIAAETQNTVSQRGILSAGFHYLGTIDFIKLPGFSWTRYSGVSRSFMPVQKQRR